MISVVRTNALSNMLHDLFSGSINFAVLWVSKGQ